MTKWVAQLTIKPPDHRLTITIFRRNFIPGWHLAVLQCIKNTFPLGLASGNTICQEMIQPDSRFGIIRTMAVQTMVLDKLLSP